MDSIEQTNAADTRKPRGADRRHQFPGRQQRINLRFDDNERHDIAAAAARTGLTPAGFCANAALAAAHNTIAPGQFVTGTGLTQAELAALQRELFAARTAVIGNKPAAKAGADFFAMLKTAGVLVRLRHSATNPDEITGYAVGPVWRVSCGPFPASSR